MTEKTLKYHWFREQRQLSERDKHEQDLPVNQSVQPSAFESFLILLLNPSSCVWGTMRPNWNRVWSRERFISSIPSVQFSCSVVSASLWPHESQHSRPPCPSPTPRVYSNSCPLSWWCHPAISSSVVPFSSCPQSLPASGSFPMSQLFASGGQSIVVSALMR